MRLPQGHRSLLRAPHGDSRALAKSALVVLLPEIPWPPDGTDYSSILQPRFIELSSISDVIMRCSCGPRYNSRDQRCSSSRRGTSMEQYYMIQEDLPKLG